MTSTDTSATDFYALVPDELKALPNWVGWKLTPAQDGKVTKLPYSSTRELASSTNKETWRLFNDVRNIPPTNEMGAGFVFDGSGISGIDLDHCIDTISGNIIPKFANLVESLSKETYTEISPSGTGLHIYIRTKEYPYYYRSQPTPDSPEGREHFGKKKNGLEVYSKVRFFTMSGNRWRDSPSSVKTFEVEKIRELCDPIFGTSDKIKEPSISYAVHHSTNLSDDDIINIISNSKQSDKFNQLMRGSTIEYNSDKSSADMALASILAFYTTDENQIERIMRSSGLVRDKWNRRDYMVDFTIRKAISSCSDHYKPSCVGDAAEGDEIAKSLGFGNATPVTTPQSVAETTAAPQSVEMTLKDITEIQNLVKQCNALPALHDIKHPFFKKWMDVGKRLMYSHPAYHLGNMLPIASMALGRRVSVLISTSYVHANIYSIVVGTSTISGKSFSSNTAIREFGVPVTSIQAPVNPEDNTTIGYKSHSNPRLVQNLSDTYNMLWYYDEAKEFFDESNERGWNAPIIGNLCSAYDGLEVGVNRSNKRRRREGEDDDNMWRCPTPFLSLLFNLTLTQLKEASTTKIVDSGFFYRWLWFIEMGGEKKPNVTASDADLKIVEEIREELLRVGLLLKQLQPNDICFRVNDRIEQWSMDISKRSGEERYQAATGRCATHIYKIAMIFAIFDPEFQPMILNQSQYPVRLELPSKWVEEAILIVEKYLLPRMLTVIEYSERVDQSNRQEWVLEKLKEMGGVAKHSDLLKKTKLDSSEFRKAISTLKESDEISTATVGAHAMYYLKQPQRGS